jgi:uncharacterized membrane protein YfcA
MIAYLWLVFAGLVAGYVNAMAGAGSLLTLPALIFSGLDANAANATNRIAVLFQTMATSYTYRRAGVTLKTRDLWVCLPAAAGAGLGAYAATLLSPAQMQLSIALVMAAMLPLVWMPKGTRVSALRSGHIDFSWGGSLVFVGIGFYIGFIQAAAGILILLYLGIVRGVSLVYSNALKVVMSMLLTVIALGVFSLTNMTLDLTRGLLLAASSAAGGVIGARMAVSRGEGLIRTVLTLTIIASATKLALDALY